MLSAYKSLVGKLKEKQDQIQSCGGPGTVKMWRPQSVTTDLGNDNSVVVLIS
jgi:hypothetical protein